MTKLLLATISYFWTTAVASYDYECCTDEMLDGFIADGVTTRAHWRLVKITDNEHTHGFASTQCDRYRSGCNAVVDASDQTKCFTLGLMPVVSIPEVHHRSPIHTTARAAAECALRVYRAERADFIPSADWRPEPCDYETLRVALIVAGCEDRTTGSSFDLLCKLFARRFAVEVERLVNSDEDYAARVERERDESARDEAADSKRRSRRDDAQDR
jgi:hypothetical protein